jgi:hypothetical protein
MPRQPHDPGARAQAKQLYLAHGSARAAELTGIPQRTIRRWARSGHWRPQPATDHQAPDQGVAGVAASGGQALQPPKGAVAAFGWQPHAVLERLTGELWAELDDLARWRAAGRPREARDTAVVCGILADKCQDLAKQIGASDDQGADASVASITAVLDAIERRVDGA